MPRAQHCSILVEGDDDQMLGRVVALGLQRGEERRGLCQHARRVGDLRSINNVSVPSDALHPPHISQLPDNLIGPALGEHPAETTGSAR